MRDFESREGLPYLLSIGLLQGFPVLMLVAFATKHPSAIQYSALSYIEPASAAPARELFTMASVR